jgi:hypothetical protein
MKSRYSKHGVSVSDTDTPWILAATYKILQYFADSRYLQNTHEVSELIFLI